MKMLYTILLSIVMLPLAVSGQEVPVLESRSKMDFASTVEAIQTAAGDNGWKVLIVHDLQASLRRNGQETLPVSVIELCKPEISGEVLANDNTRSLSVFMPCRISVYEKGNGEVYLSRMNIRSLDSSSLAADASDKLIEASGQLEMIIAGMID